MFKNIQNIKSLLANPIQQDGTFEVFQLEQKLAQYYKKKYCLLMSNATTALYSYALAGAITDGHIIAPAFGWSGSIAPFLHFSNKISFAGIDENYCLDPQKLKELILPNTIAIISIDTGGYAANSKEIAQIAQKNGLLYISDSAESLGANRDNKPAGAFADAIIVSFTIGKTINAGEMGAILTNDKNIYEKIVQLTQHPHRQKKEFGTSNWYPFSPLNGRVHPLAAIMANQEFDSLDKTLSARRTKALKIIEELVDNGTINYKKLIAEHTTFFEYYSESKVNIELFHKCNADSFWYLDNNLSGYNLIDLTQRYFNKAIVHSNLQEDRKQFDKLIKIQFNW